MYGLKRCSECSRGFMLKNGHQQGYYCCGEYYCSLECLRIGSLEDGEEWQDHYEDGGECYWSEWEYTSEDELTGDLYIATDNGVAYRLKDGELEFTPLIKDSPDDSNYWIYSEEWELVEPDLVGEEVTTFRGMDVTLNQVFEYVTAILMRRPNEHLLKQMRKG